MSKANVDPNTGAILMTLDEGSRGFLRQLVEDATAEIKQAINSAAMIAPARPAASTGGQRSNGAAPTTFPNYGKAKNAPIAGASSGDLEYYANGARRSLADPEKARFHAKEQALLDAIEAEQRRQSGGGSAAGFPTGAEPDPDQDIPFAFIETRLDQP